VPCLFFQVVKNETLEIRNHHITRQLLVVQPLKVIGCLLEGRFEIGPGALVLGQHQAGPEHVDAPQARMLQTADGFLIDGNAPALHAKHGEEFVPEGLRLGALGGNAGPVVGETLGVGANFLPGDGHD